MLINPVKWFNKKFPPKNKLIANVLVQVLRDNAVNEISVAQIYSTVSNLTDNNPKIFDILNILKASNITDENILGAVKIALEDFEFRNK